MADPTAQQTTPLFGVPMGGVAPAAAPPQAAPVAAPVQPKRYEEQDGKHRGVAGVARDILGTLGDFLLTRLRLPAMYGPAQQQRRLAAAQANIDSDPVGAIQQVSSIDPVFGAKLRDQYIDNQRLAATEASTKEARDARLAQAQALTDDRTRSRSAAMLGTMATWDDTRRSSNYGALREQAIRYGQANGLDLSNELPTEFDPVQLDSFIDSSVPVGTQRAQRLTRDRLDQQQDQFEQRDATTRRGQDIGSTDRRRGQDVTVRGQDVRSADTRRGQDTTSADRRRGQDEQGRHNRRMEERPGRFTPDPNRIYVQKGRRYRYNAQTKTYELVN
jgi:hypothetical protein